MARKKRITLILIILSTLLLAGPGVVDIANAEPISSSIPTDFERQSVPRLFLLQIQSMMVLLKNPLNGIWVGIRLTATGSMWIQLIRSRCILAGSIPMGPGMARPSTHAMAVGPMSAMAPRTGLTPPARWRPGGSLDGGTWLRDGLRRPRLRLAPPSAAPGTGLIPSPMPWQPAFTSATAPCTGFIRPAHGDRVAPRRRTWYYATGSGAGARTRIRRRRALLLRRPDGGHADGLSDRRAGRPPLLRPAAAPLTVGGLVDGSWCWFADGIALDRLALHRRFLVLARPPTRAAPW